MCTIMLVVSFWSDWEGVGVQKEKACYPCTGQGRPQSRPPIPPQLPSTHGGPSKPAATSQRPSSAQASKQTPPMPASGSQAKPDQAAQSHTAEPAQAFSTERQLHKQGEKSKVRGI